MKVLIVLGSAQRGQERPTDFDKRILRAWIMDMVLSDFQIERASSSVAKALIPTWKDPIVAMGKDAHEICMRLGKKAIELPFPSLDNATALDDQYMRRMLWRARNEILRQRDKDVPRARKFTIIRED